MLDLEPLSSGVAAAVPRFRINEKDFLLGGLSCSARLPLRVIQLADLACITKLTLTEIHGLTILDLAMFLPLEGLEALTVSACPSFITVVMNTAMWEGSTPARRLAKE